MKNVLLIILICLLIIAVFYMVFAYFRLKKLRENIIIISSKLKELIEKQIEILNKDKKIDKETKKYLNMLNKEKEVTGMIDIYYNIEENYKNSKNKGYLENEEKIVELKTDYNNSVLKYYSISHFVLSNIVAKIFKFDSYTYFRR